MFDTWASIGVIGGTGALTYLAAGRKDADQGEKRTWRLSLDKGNSLVGDVRFLGGGLVTAAAVYAKDASAKKGLAAIAVASFASLLSTELVRYKLKKDAGADAPAQGYIVPQFKFFQNRYGGLEGPAGSSAYGNYQAQNQGAWAQR